MHTVLKGMRAKRQKKQGDANEMFPGCDFVFELGVNTNDSVKYLKYKLKQKIL